ncbi:Hydroxyethylthiazole kinase [bioreactor metagenome]|uniref:hydroxyethylthiazole kinase n=1 Tax=bioreactor metagenome TaxID=1076179 RepID=A0A644TS02_9ZZZZ
MLKRLWEVREEVRKRRPLIVNITNNVVTNFTANVLLSAGASPLMSEEIEEAEALAKIADAVVLNIGTLHVRQVRYCLKAGAQANLFGKPVIFDPVGVGATPFRDQTAQQILSKIEVSLIRGNYGEISFLAGAANEVTGVDNTSAETDADMLQRLAKDTGAVVAATGQTDYVTDGGAVFTNATGHILLQSVTGTGCALTSLAGAFMAVADDKKVGVLAALAFYGAAAEKAAEKAKGPASFAVRFVDTLYTLTYKDFKKLTEGKIAGIGDSVDSVDSVGACLNE